MLFTFRKNAVVCLIFGRDFSFVGRVKSISGKKIVIVSQISIIVDQDENGYPGIDTKRTIDSTEEIHLNLEAVIGWKYAKPTEINSVETIVEKAIKPEMRVNYYYDGYCHGDDK